ncbi:MAG: DUF6516 family protein [bacterium]|nr:DUF6516 family protein [bacterium]
MRIEVYLQQIKRIIDASPFIVLKRIELDTRTEFTGIIRGSLVFINNTVLHFREVIDVEYRIERIKYSYQYQDYITNESIFRYDNAKHHPEIKTFPHHKHTKVKGIIEAKEVSLINVIKEIEVEYLVTIHCG